MPDHDYLVIGGGMTADAAVKGIRKTDSTGSIGIIAAEPHKPYKRPPLSKALWKGEPIDSIWLKTPGKALTFYTSTRAGSIRPERHTVIDSSGTEYSYRKLLLATGGKVRRFPFETDGVIFYRTFDDFGALKAAAQPGKTAIVIGGGFIGSEIAAALAMNGVKTTLVLPQEGIGSRIYPRRLSQFLNDYYMSKGVTPCTKQTVTRIDRHRDTFTVTTSGAGDLKADCVVAGLGIEPDVALARDAGITVDNGIVVDDHLRTSAADIFAAGDVANFYNPALEKRMRVEHEDNASIMGESAGRSMAGENVAYDYLPMFYSDLFDLGYEAVGDLDSRLETVEDWKVEFKEGVVYYLDKQRVRGVLLWNVWGKVDDARRLIAEKNQVSPDMLRGLLG